GEPTGQKPIKLCHPRRIPLMEFPDTAKATKSTPMVIFHNVTDIFNKIRKIIYLNAEIGRNIISKYLKSRFRLVIQRYDRRKYRAGYMDCSCPFDAPRPGIVR